MMRSVRVWSNPDVKSRRVCWQNVARHSAEHDSKAPQSTGGVFYTALLGVGFNYATFERSCSTIEYLLPSVPGRVRGFTNVESAQRWLP